MKKQLLALSLYIAGSVFAAEKAIDLKVQDKFRSLPADSIRLHGVIGSALDTSIKGISAKNVDMLVFPFKARTEMNTWKSEFWGKWFTSVAWAYDYTSTEQLDKILKYATSELMKTQDKEGAIKTVCPEWEFKLMGHPTHFQNMTWDIWGRKYVLLGLLAEYERTSDKAVLQSAMRHADYIITRIGEGKGKKDICDIGMWFGVASSSILEPIALLYQYSGEKRYLDFANYIIDAQHKSPLGKDFFRKMLAGAVITDVFHKAGDPQYPNYAAGGSKAYETMSCFEGLLEMYRATGNPDYLKASENLAKSVRETETVITGSSSINEKWRRSKLEQHADTENWQETCVSATWIKLCTQLLRLTGNPDYMGDIELAAYNVMIAAQNDDGSWWCHNSPINGTRKAATAQCKRGDTLWHDRSKPLANEPKFVMNCCVASGPRGLFTLPKSVFMAYDDGIVVNMYEKSTAVIPVKDTEVSLNVSGLEWGRNNTAKIEVSPKADIRKLPQSKMRFGVKLYVPQWSKNTKILVNGKEVDSKIEAGKYCDINRAWKKGDIIEVKLDAKVEMLTLPGTTDIFYLKYGPFVLSMDKRFEKNFDKPADIADINGVVNAKGLIICGKPVIVKEGTRTSFGQGVSSVVAFEVPLKDGSTRTFINYSDAGDTWDSNSTFTTMFKRNGNIKYIPVGNLYKGK